MESQVSFPSVLDPLQHSMSPDFLFSGSLDLVLSSLTSLYEDRSSSPVFLPVPTEKRDVTRGITHGNCTGTSGFHPKVPIEVEDEKGVRVDTTWGFTRDNVNVLQGG